MNEWQEAQEWERSWWGFVNNTYGEEEKQLVYAAKMGIPRIATPETAYNLDAGNCTVLDIGSGPVSLLLKCLNLRQGYAVDPLMDEWPAWVRMRYESSGIVAIACKGEDIDNSIAVDEVWMYNVLEHTEDPLKVVRNAQRAGDLIRIFEWIDTPPAPGHPHSFAEKQLNEWLGGEGKTEMFARGRTRGRGYYGVFPC